MVYPVTKSTLLILSLYLAMSLGTARAASNWKGPYAPCTHHGDLLTREHVDLGVKISTSNPGLARQFRRAMDFWSEVLDVDWHEVASEDCSIQLVDGTPEVFSFEGACSCAVARSQFPEQSDFQGWIAFNPTLESSPEEMFRDAVHEIGHLFGLHHNPDISSVMFFSDFGQTVSLDGADLKALGAQHKLRMERSKSKSPNGAVPILAFRRE